MKKILLTLILFTCLKGLYAQKLTYTKGYPVALSGGTVSVDSPKTAIDTIKVRIQIDDGPGLAILINGYLVRKFISYGHKHPWGNIWSKDRFMDETWDTIDPIKIWDYRERNWEYGKDTISRHNFIVPRNFKGL